MIFIFVVCVPVLLMTVLYSWLMVSLSIHSKQLSAQASEVRKQRRKEDIRVLRKVVLMLAAFLTSIVPITVLGVLSFYVWDGVLPCNAWIFSFLAHILFLSNSGINPCLCIALHESYRHYMRKHFFSWRYTMSVTSPSSSTKLNEMELNTQSTVQRWDTANDPQKSFLRSNSPNFLQVLDTTTLTSIQNSNGLRILKY